MTQAKRPIQTGKHAKSYLAKIGKRGGVASGKRKSRGDAEYYRAISALSAAKRRKENNTEKGTDHE
jgi:hypothetical protein